MNIIISGDFFVSDNFKNQSLIGDSVKELFDSGDFRIVNLEAPLTANNPKNRILKTGPHLRSTRETVIPYLCRLKTDLVTLANNHILDYGINGLEDTCLTLVDNKIAFVGVGSNILEASKPFTIEKDDLKIAILNFAENEWSIAEDDEAGANPLDIIGNVNQIKLARTSHDKVICIIHGGHEYHHLPSPRMVKQYHFYAENGADAIVGHHTHCIGGHELHNNVPIIYSLGNFLFTLPSKRAEWYSGLVLQLDINKDGPITFKLIPVQQEKVTFETKLLNGIGRIEILQKVQDYSEIVQNDFVLNKSWNTFVKTRSQEYLNYFSPLQFITNRYLHAGLKKLRINKLVMSKKHYKLLLNIIRCESHKEGAIASLKDFMVK